MSARFNNLKHPYPQPFGWRDGIWIVGIIIFGLFMAAMWLVVSAGHVGATWKPEYASAPQPVRDWFSAQIINPQSAKRLGLEPGASCCDNADRVLTKFIGGAGHDWSYYTDAACVRSGCPLAPIPNDAIHGEIRALNPRDDALPEFEEMRREGVLMIWQGKVTCFWAPEPSI